MYLTRRQYEVLRSIRSGLAIFSRLWPGLYSLCTGYTEITTVRTLSHLGLIGSVNILGVVAYDITPDGERLLELMPTWLSRRQQELLIGDKYAHKWTLREYGPTNCWFNWAPKDYTYATITVYTLLDAGLMALCDGQTATLTEDGAELAVLLIR